MTNTAGITRYQVYNFVLETKSKRRFSCDIVVPITTSKNYGIMNTAILNTSKKILLCEDQQNAIMITFSRLQLSFQQFILRDQY